MQSEPEVEPVTVAIACGDPLVRSSLASALRARPELEVVAEVELADVVVWDAGPVSSAASSAWQELETIAAPVLALIADPALASAALEAGARGAIAREVSPFALCAAVLAVHHGLLVLDSGARAQLVASKHAEALSAASESEELTARELEILVLVARGLSNAEIAEQLVLSPLTVKTHVARVLDKLNLRDRIQAVVLAYENGIVRPGGDQPLVAQ